MLDSLTSTQRRTLRARAHSLHPVVFIGDKGLTDPVLQEIEISLRSHELIKIKAQSERDEREVLLSEICERLGAQPVQHIGKVLVIYRERPPEEKKEAPAPRRLAAPPRAGQSKRAADRARKRISAARAPATAPIRRRARTR